MTNAELKTLFTNFLAKQGITAHFMIALKTDTTYQYKGIDDCDHINQYLEEAAIPEKLIENAFEWFYAVQGIAFWKRHNKAWLIYLKDFTNV